MNIKAITLKANDHRNVIDKYLEGERTKRKEMCINVVGEIEDLDDEEECEGSHHSGASDVQAYGIASGSERDDKADWNARVKVVLEAFETEILDTYLEKHLSDLQTGVFTNKLINFLSNHISDLDAFSLPWFAILWVSDLLADKRINGQTAKAYLRELVTRTGCTHSMAHDMRLWSNEDIVALIELVCSKGDLADSTYVQRAKRLVRLLNYCKAKGILTKIPIPRVRYGYISYWRRTSLISHDRIEDFLRRFAAKSDAKSRATIVSTILAFYAGLRHDEIDRLVLANIAVYASIFSDGDFGEGKGQKVRITVRRGKSANARRSIYLHLLAPPHVVAEFVRCVSHRRDLFNSNANTKKLALIGLDSDRQGFRSLSVRQAVLKQLRKK